MSPLKIGIVEDEVIIADTLGDILANIGYEITEPASSYDEALIMIAKEKPDLLLLDINLKGKKDGIDLAWKIKENYDIPFIYLTANADAVTVSRAKETEPPSFLVKPFNKDDLFTSIEICFHNHAKKQEALRSENNDILSDAIFIKEGSYFHKIKYSDILYLESDHVYVNVYTIGKKLLVRSSMQQYLQHFNTRQFFRIHRSYVVNIEHIQTINTDTILVHNISLPIAKTYREALLSKVKLG